MSFRSGQRRRVVLNFDPSKEPSRTKQSFREECDINVLMAKYQKQGVISHVNPRQPVYADVTAALPFQEALAVVQAAQAAFSQLPATVRSRFENDPGRFVEFCSDPANLDEMGKLGLLRSPPSSNKPGDGGEGAGSQPGPAPSPPEK